MKRVVLKIPFSKICSIVTAVCFLVSTIGSNLYASATPLTFSSCDDIFNSMSVIKQEYGKVTAVQDSSSDITVVNIQDLHCHEQTQRNISEIIKTLDKNYSLKSVFIEGGYGQIDVSWINKVQDEKIRNSMIEKMLQSGYLTGAEYYAVKNSKYDLLNGIEEKDIHQANLNRLSKIIEKQPQYNSVVSKVNKEIEVLSNIHLNEKNKRFSRKINDYRNGKTDTLKFYRLLAKYVEKINSVPEQYNNITAINFDDYPNISKYINISQQSKDTNPRQVSIELQTLINIIKNKIPYSSYKKLLDITKNFTDTEKLVEFLAKFSEQYDIDLSKDFKELNNFFTANRLNQNLNPIELVNEERKLIEQIRMALSYDNTEYEISYIADFSIYFEDYLTYSLTSSDWKYIKQDFEKFRLLYSKYATVDRINEIASDINFINDYYDTNDARNDIFVSNILKNENPQQNLNVLRTSDEILKQSREVFVVITGGYHSDALKSIFADRKVNDIVITPNVTGDIKDADQKYNRIIEDQKAVESNALALRLASCLTDENQKNLMAKVALDILGKDKLEQIRALVGQDIDISKIENIQVDEQKKSEIISLIQTAVNSLGTVLPLQTGQNFFKPDIDNILTEMSLKLYDMGFYFENGTVYEIDSSEYKDKDLLGIPAEVYSKMFGSLQKAMLKAEQIRDGVPTAKNIRIQWSSFPDKAFILIQEVLFRALPAFIIIFNPVIGVPLFILLQMVSLSLEMVVQWKIYKSSDINNPDILKRYINKLPLITILLMAPYIMAFAVNIAYFPVALVATIVIHYLFVKIFSVNRNFQNRLSSPFLIAPSMGVFWRATGIIDRYRTALKNRNDKKADSQRYKLKTDISYETIIRDRNNSASLENVIKNEQLDVKYRLFALMYFKTNNLDVYNGVTENVIDKEITEKIKKDFKNSLQKNKINNNFDLRANLTGIFLILDDMLHEQLHGNSYRIYEEIQDAVILRANITKFGARADFTFMIMDYETLAHEIGHRILKYSSMEGDLTLGELFAETISNIIAHEFNIIPAKSGAQLYGLFDPNINYIRVFQEEHEAADGFLNLIKQSTEGNPNWLVLIDTIINYGYYKEGFKRPTAQGLILKDILTGYEEALRQTGESNIVDFAKKRTAKYSIALDILKDIEQKNPYQYDKILKKIKSKAKIQKSYKQEDIAKTRFWQSKSKVEELFNIISGLFSSEKLYDFEIISAIFSSPDKIDSVLNDMFDVIFENTSYSMYDFENLYRIKLLMAHDRTYTSKEELEQYLKPIIDLITSSRRTEPTNDDFINLKKSKRYTLKNNFRLTIIENFNKLGLPELIETLFSHKTSDTDKTVSKLSIFDALKNKNAVFSFLAKTAPVWEEILFRAVPSFITIFNPVLGISLFAVSQIAFLFSHTIVKWLVYKDSAGNKLSFAGLLKDDFKNLSLPSLVLAIPYILTMIVAPVFLPVATLSAIIIHSLNNKLSIFGSYNDVQLKNQFELKLPFEELGIKIGDKVLITYIGDGALLFSRNIEEINALFELLSEQKPEKRRIYELQIYPNTFEFTVKKGGIVNIKQLADSLGRKKQNIEGENGVKLLYRIEPLQEPDEEKTKESDLQPNEDKQEQKTESDENKFVSEAIILDELIKKLEPAKVIELDFSRFIDAEGENDNSEAINSYIREIIANNDLRNAFITLTFSKLYGTNLDENKIKTVSRILSVLSDEIDGIFTDKIGNVAGVSFFEDILENAFVHGNNLSLNKKIFIYFGNDRDVIVINSNTPQNKTIESLTFASKLNLYGFGSGIKSAEKVSNARYSVTDIVMPDKTKIELYVAYITFRKYQQLKRTLLDKALKKINASAIWQTTETKNIERQYSYAEIPALEEGESVFATNFVKGGAEYSGDWVEFKISKKNGAYVVSEVTKRENKFKWYMPYEAQIPLEEKLEVVEENGKFYIRSNYTGIRVLKTQADQGLEKEIDPSISLQKPESSEKQTDILSQQQDLKGNYEFERLFRLVHRDSSLKPVIGDSKSYEYRIKLQKLCYALADKLDLNEIEELYRDNEEKLRLARYLRILKFKRLNDNESLQAIVYNNGLDIKYRLMAYMYLRSNGINDFSDRILEIMKENFITGLTSGSFKIDNNFDLSVLGAGILLVLNKYLVQNKYIDQQQEKNLYENISYSTFVDNSELEGTSANSGMFFTSPDPLTMAHEIGHRVLLFYTDSSKGVAYSTIHEIFAGVISAVFAEKAGMESKYYEDALYELFNTRMQYDYVLQEEHKASRGLLYTITAIAKQMGKTVKFEILADAVINLIKTKKVLPSRQSDTIRELLAEYINMLKFKDNYTQDDVSKFEEILKEESWKSKVLELFMNLRGASGRNWDYYGTKYKKIMDGMRMYVAETQSYRHGILEIDYREDLVVINNIIMSQPDKINMILQIVKDELGQSDYLLRPEIAKLIFADLIISLPQMKDLSKYQLDRLIQDIVDKFFSDKVDYKSSEIDYQKIRVYALKEYIFFKIFVPRKFGGKSLANINSITSGKYIERIHDDRHDYSYAESLPPVVPSIDTFFMHFGLVRLYRHIFEVLTKKMVKSKKSLKLSKSMEDYLDIYKIKDNNRSLAKVIYNDKLSLKHRLFAFMYLKINGGNVEDPVVINNIKREFAQAIHKNKLQIRNNFDLRAVVTGVYLLLEDFSKEYVSKEKYTETYKSISKAVVLRRGKESIGARANMTFVSVSPLTIAHELGHRILSSSSSTFVDDVTIHELFAYTISNMFKKIVDIDEQEYKYSLYSLFNKSANYDEVFQNEHQASKGLISLLKSVSNHIGKDVKWDILADAIISYVLSSPERVKESNQGTNLRNIFIEYLTQLDAEKHYSRYDLREMFAFAKNVTSGETVLIDILANIKETDRKQYDAILKQMQEKIKPHKSYMKGFLLRMLHSKSKIKEFSDIIKELLGIKPEYRDDTEIINKIIFSQPIQVKNISQIIRAQILRKQEYTKQDFENLIKAEFLFQYNGKYYSKEELDAFMQNVVQNILRIVGNDTFHQHYNTYGYGDYLEAKSYIAQQKARTLQTNKTVEILNRLGNSLYSDKAKADNFRYSLFGIAIGVILETFSFWMPGFIKQHENPTKTMIVTTWGIRILSAVLAITSGFIFVPIAVPVVLIAVEWITHFVYNLLEIKRMNKNIIVQFEAVDTLNTTVSIVDDSVVPVLLLKDIKSADTNLLINTGLKVNGETIWQIDIKDSVVFVASDTDIKDLALVLNGSKTLEKRLRKVLKLNNIKLNVENSVIVDEKTEETYFQNSVAVVNNNKYVQPMIRALKSISFMYSQKTIISLEKVSNNKLYQSLINGKTRKIITAEQFEYIKQLLQQEHKNIKQEILNLRNNGVEIYVKENELTDKYKEYGIIGLLLGAEIYDYYTDEKIEIEIVDSKITLQELESKLINSDKPLLMDIISLQNIFKSTRSIVGAYSGLEALIGNIKIKFGFKNIKARDMENFAHSIDMNDIPDVINDDVNKMFAGDIFNFSAILNLDDGNIISIILNDVNVSEQAKQLFLNTIKERILLKHIQQNREKELNLKYSKYGFKDKKLEKLLGKALYLKMQFAGEQSIDLQNDIDNKLNNLTPAELMGKITELSQQAFAGRDPVAIATIIELIMICAEEYRNDDMGSLTKNDLLREYKSMLSAA